MRAAAWVGLLAGCGRVEFASLDTIDDASTTASAAYASTIVAAGPLAYFRLDESAGPTARSLVNGYTATYEGAFAFGTPGPLAGDACARFDHRTTRLVLGDVFPFAGNAPHSLEAWVRPTEVLSDTHFIFNRGPDEGYTVYTGIDYTLYARTTVGSEFCYSSGGALPANAWSHVVATYDGAVSRMYIDGAEVGNNVGAPGPIGTEVTSLVVGDSTGGQFNKFVGCIDEIAIYDRALSADEVADHHRRVP